MNLQFKIFQIFHLISSLNENKQMNFKKKRTREKIFRIGWENYTEKSSYQNWKMGIGRLLLRNVMKRKDLWCFTSINEESQLMKIYSCVMMCSCILWVSQIIWFLEWVRSKMKENESSNRWHLRNLQFLLLLYSRRRQHLKCWVREQDRCVKWMKLLKWWSQQMNS